MICTPSSCAAYKCKTKACTHFMGHNLMKCVNVLFCVYTEMIYMHSAALFNWQWEIVRLIDNTIMLFNMLYAFLTNMIL